MPCQPTGDPLTVRYAWFFDSGEGGLDKGPRRALAAPGIYSWREIPLKPANLRCPVGGALPRHHPQRRVGISGGGRVGM
jgi:hypothetical protein